MMLRDFIGLMIQRDLLVRWWMLHISSYIFIIWMFGSCFPLQRMECTSTSIHQPPVTFSRLLTFRGPFSKRGSWSQTWTLEVRCQGFGWEQKSLLTGSWRFFRRLPAVEHGMLSVSKFHIIHPICVGIP